MEGVGGGGRGREWTGGGKSGSGSWAGSGCGDRGGWGGLVVGVGWEVGVGIGARMGGGGGLVVGVGREVPDGGRGSRVWWWGLDGKSEGWGLEGGSGGGGKVYGGVELCGGIVGRAGRNCATSNTVLGANIPKFQNATNIEELKIFF